MVPGHPFVDDVAWLAEGANLNEESFSCACIFSLCLSFVLSFVLLLWGKGQGELEINWEGSC